MPTLWSEFSSLQYDKSSTTSVPDLIEEICTREYRPMRAKPDSNPTVLINSALSKMYWGFPANIGIFIEKVYLIVL